MNEKLSAPRCADDVSNRYFCDTFALLLATLYNIDAIGWQPENNFH